jgi:hypothetical protein
MRKFIMNLSAFMLSAACMARPTCNPVADVVPSAFVSGIRVEPLADAI